MLRTQAITCLTLLAVAFAGRVSAQSFNLPLYRDGTAQNGEEIVNPSVTGQDTAQVFGGTFSQNGGTTDTNDTYTTQATGQAVSSVGTSRTTAQTSGTASCLTATGATTYSAQVDTEVSAQGDAAAGEPPRMGFSQWTNDATVETVFVIQQNPDHSDVTAATLQGSMYFLGITNVADAIDNAEQVASVTIGGSNAQANAYENGTWTIFYFTQHSTSTNPTASPSMGSISSALGMNSLIGCTQWVAPGSRIALRGEAGGQGAVNTGSEDVSYSLNMKGSGSFEVIAP